MGRKTRKVIVQEFHPEYYLYSAFKVGDRGYVEEYTWICSIFACNKMPVFECGKLLLCKDHAPDAKVGLRMIVAQQPPLWEGVEVE